MLSRCNRLLWLTCDFATLVFAQPALGESLPDEKPLVIRHRDADADGWSIAETRNFEIIVHYHSRTLAERSCRGGTSPHDCPDGHFEEPGEDSGPSLRPVPVTRLPPTSAATPAFRKRCRESAATRCDSGRVLSRRMGGGLVRNIVSEPSLKYTR